MTQTNPLGLSPVTVHPPVLAVRHHSEHQRGGLACGGDIVHPYDGRTTLCSQCNCDRGGEVALGRVGDIQKATEERFTRTFPP